MCFSILHVLSHDFTQRYQIERLLALDGKRELLNKLLIRIIVDPQIFFALKRQKNLFFIYICDYLDPVSLFFLEKIRLSHNAVILFIYFNPIHSFVGPYQEQPWVRCPRNHIHMTLFILKRICSQHFIALDMNQ